MNTALNRIQSEVLLQLLQARRPLLQPKPFYDEVPLTRTMRLLMLWPDLSVWLIAELLPLQLNCLLGRNGRSLARSLLREQEAGVRLHSAELQDSFHKYFTTG